MKRALSIDGDPTPSDEKKKTKIEVEEEQLGEEEEETGFGRLDDDLLFEVLKHVDSRTLATAACVSKQWHKAAQDERLWEMICTSHWASTGGGNQQLRSVVLALGGFRRLHSLYLRPLLKPPSSMSPSPSLSSSVFPPSAIPSKSKMSTHWGKDELHLSLSLFSIRYYEKMNLDNRSGR